MDSTNVFSVKDTRRLGLLHDAPYSSNSYHKIFQSSSGPNSASNRKKCRVSSCSRFGHHHRKRFQIGYELAIIVKRLPVASRLTNDLKLFMLIIFLLNRLLSISVKLHECSYAHYPVGLLNKFAKFFFTGG